MKDGTPGLYESVISELLHDELQSVQESYTVDRERLMPADVGDRMALHLSRSIVRAIDAVKEEDRIAAAVGIARQILAELGDWVESEHASGLLGARPRSEGEILRAIRARQPDGSVRPIPSPLTPLLDTTVLTNARGEPAIGIQTRSEIGSADRIDLVMAFIRRSGLRPLREDLRRFCADGGQLRVLTTTYTGSTECEALVQLQDLGAEVRVSYDTSSTRLHAKSWIFHRDSGFSTAFIGSSNLTHSAQVTGLEWTVRVSGVRNGHALAKMAAVFEAYWNSGDFEPFAEAQFRQLTQLDRSGAEVFSLSPIEVRAWPFQDRLLEQIGLARQQGHRRNLLVAATGTGKTVMAAIDYRRLAERLPRARLLFVAHRRELLEQSRATFRQVLRKPAFGELWVGGQRPADFEHVFASIQSLHASDLQHLDARHFDVVIVDEFHHATAPSYRRLLEHLQPAELLGLTATPVRSDGLDVLSYFDGRIAAELRLWDAIEQQRLVPFEYYGIHDNLDLREVPWRRGVGYDPEGLTNLLTANDAWAKQVLTSLHEHVDDVRRMRALGFCVSVDHARFMARVFAAAGVPSAAVWGETPEGERRQALEGLREGEISILFCVDLFNEGVDLPKLDTLLMLRPTESPTVFIQQLGRGLRRAEGKTTCTVLDFVGQHVRGFRYDRRFLALFGGTRKALIEQVKAGFPLMPAGCHMQLDRVAQQVVLDSLKNALPSAWRAKAGELSRQAAGGGEVGLAEFLEESGLELGDVYEQKRGWSDLREAAGLAVAVAGPHEAALRRGVGRLLHVDDAERLSSWLDFLGPNQAPEVAALDERGRRFLRMLVAQVGDQVFKKGVDLQAACALLWEHPQVRAELRELCEILRGQESHLHPAWEGGSEVPLQVHARYTRIEVLAAFGVGQDAKVGAWQTGVRWLPEAGVDLLAFTLDKANGKFSPTTRYRDYAISRELIHWESQSSTRAASETGQRYQQHLARGSRVLLFARLRQDERAFWFLGPARFVSSEGEQPMAITWRLEHPLPGDLFAEFGAAVA